MISNEIIEVLFAKAKMAMANSYSPYSKFPVGAAFLANNGQVYAGCNIENACYAMGQCAEVSALGTLISAGAKWIDAVVLVSQAQVPIIPCGGCLQKIGEFVTAETILLSESCQGERRQWRFSELFPMHFDQTILQNV